jgi:glycosyltransferase involved in cell wall biosynthesis
MIVTHYFPPEIGAPQARLSELASAWQESGLDVTVLTGMPNHPTGVKPPEYRRAVRRLENVEGVRIVRTWLYATPNEGIVKKTLGHLSFTASSVLLGVRPTGMQDVVVVSSPTFFSIGSAWLLAKVKGAKFVVEVRDLWPAIFVELGVLRNRLAISILERMELAAYRAADAVVVVTEGFRGQIAARGVPIEKIITIPNGADLDRFEPRPGSDEIRTLLGAGPDDVLVLYLGAHGISQGLVTVVEAAERLKGDPIHFAMVGEGADKSRVAAAVRERALENVTMLGGVARDKVTDLIAAADICLVPLRDVPLFGTFIPSKMFEYLAMGKAVVGSLSGEAASILQAAGGSVVGPDNSLELAEAIAALAADPSRRSSMGERGRAYVRGNFDRRVLAERYRQLLLSLVAER